MIVVKVDVITAVYNAESTIKDTVRSAMHQEVPQHLLQPIIQSLFSANSRQQKQEQQRQRQQIHFDICVCCYDDASTDGSLAILASLEKETKWQGSSSSADTIIHDSESEIVTTIQTKLLIGSAPNGTFSRGAGYARNQAIKLRDDIDGENAENNGSTVSEGQDHMQHHFLCILDSDDIMHSTRIAEQTCAMLSLDADECKKTLMGCQFDRIPKDSTHHYSQWANSLSDERLYLEKFRECTLIQPTWFLTKDWFERLGGYVEAPLIDDDLNPSKRPKLISESFKSSNDNLLSICSSTASGCHSYRLVHPSEILDSRIIKNQLQSNEKRKVSACHDSSAATLRLAEDTRFFYAHLHAGGRLRLHRSLTALVSYRHRAGMSQSSSTPRKLLLKLRAKAWEDLVFYSTASENGCNNAKWSNGFAIWGAGRDGKDFLKALSPEVASKVVCFVEVDQKKIEITKWYANPALGDRRIPILHFSMLAKRIICEEVKFGHIDKKRCGVDQFSIVSQQRTDCIHKPKNVKNNKNKKSDTSIEPKIMQQLPVVVCVAMYRSNGALESNVASIGRVEGFDLWHLI